VNKNHFVLSFESYSLWLNALIFLLILAELLYRDGTIMAYVGGAVVFVAAIGAIMTSIYLLGMLERQTEPCLASDGTPPLPCSSILAGWRCFISSRSDAYYGARIR
jgi:hypothetical protein